MGQWDRGKKQVENPAFGSIPATGLALQRPIQPSQFPWPPQLLRTGILPTPAALGPLSRP